MSAVVVYGTRQCSDCHIARQTLSELGETFDWIDLDEHPEEVPVVLALNAGMHVVPTIVLPDGTILVEPDVGELTAAIARLRDNRLAETVRVEPVTRQWAEALAEGDAVFAERFGIAVEAGWAGFPEALTLIVEASLTAPSDWGPHLFFDADGALVGNGGWKGAPVDGAVELGYAVSPARQGRGIATAVVNELLRRARLAGVRTVLAHTLAEESASTTVLKRCGFRRVGELRDPVDGPVWRWELAIAGDADSEELTLALAGPDRVDELQDLWLALHWHHRSTANVQPLVDDRNSWLRRRSFYLQRLDDGTAFLVIARYGHKNVGYAMVLLETGPDDTWPLADAYAELYSLSIAPGYRRKGIGTRLMDFIDRELDRRGIRDLRVSVMVGNREAQRFYERRGLVPAEVVLYRLEPGGPATSQKPKDV